MAGDMIKDLATPAHQPGQALFWLPVRLLQSWRDALLLRDLGGTGVQRAHGAGKHSLHLCKGNVLGSILYPSAILSPV